MKYLLIAISLFTAATAANAREANITLTEKGAILGAIADHKTIKILNSQETWSDKAMEASIKSDLERLLSNTDTDYEKHVIVLSFKCSSLANGYDCLIGIKEEDVGEIIGESTYEIRALVLKDNCGFKVKSVTMDMNRFAG